MTDRLIPIIQRFIALPRIVRVIISAFFAVATTLAISPLIDYIYLQYMFTFETRILPSLVTVTLGCLMYVIGWRIYVGTVNTIPQARIHVLWYFVIGIVATIIVIVLMIQGVAILNLPD